MAYDQKLADRVREALAERDDVREQMMFQGLAFMVDEKLCICVRGDVLMCRIGPDEYEQALEMNGVSAMFHSGRVMKGYVFVAPEGYHSGKLFNGWVQKCLEFNPAAQSSKKKK